MKHTLESPKSVEHVLETVTFEKGVREHLAQSDFQLCVVRAAERADAILAAHKTPELAAPQAQEVQ